MDLTEVYSGPIKVTIGTTSPVIFNPILEDGVKLNIDPVEGTRTLADGSTLSHTNGHDLTLEITTDQMSLADAGTIEDAKGENVVIEFLDISSATPKWTIAAMQNIMVAWSEFKTVITCKKSLGAASSVADFVAMAAAD